MTLPNNIWRIAVGVSGSGRSLENFLTQQQNPSHRFEVCAVIASNFSCRAVSIAEKYQLPLFIGDFSRQDKVLAQDLEQWLGGHKIDLIALAGFIRKFPVMEAWHNKVINIHPALLPQFGGKGMYGDFVHQAVLKAGEKVSGASVHYVNAHYDEGRILAQSRVKIEAKDNVDTLAAKVFATECKLYPEVISQLHSKKLPLANQEVAVYEF